MELATTQSVLMQIQPTIQRFARMLASVLQLEVEIVDENLCLRDPLIISPKRNHV